MEYGRKEKLNGVIPILEQRPGVVEVRVWINLGNLKTAAIYIMFPLVPGRFRIDMGSYVYGG